MGLKPQPKRVLVNDRAFRAYIRGFNCIACGATADATRIEAAHVKVKLAKGDKKNVVPLCWVCHRRQHTLGIKLFEERYGLDLEEIAAGLWESYAGGAEAPPTG